MRRVNYPVQSIKPNGRRVVAFDSKDNPAEDVEHVTGWGMLPADRPNHKKRKAKR